MDVQKVSPLANALSNAKAQNSGDILDGVSKLASSFANMIRGPQAELSSLFSENDQNVLPASQAAEMQKKSNDPERKNSDDNDYRADDVSRSDDSRDAKDNVSSSNKADNGARDDHNDSRDNAHDDQNDQPVARDDTTKQASDDNHDASSDDDNQTSEQSTSDNENGDGSSTEDNSAEASDNSDTTVAVAQGSNADGFDAAIEGLIAAAHGTSNETTVKEAVKNLTTIVNGNAGKSLENTIDPLANMPIDIAGQNAANISGNKDQLLMPGSTPDEVINNDQIQKVLRAVARLGVGTTPTNIAQAAKSADVPLSENQARLLSDALKSDRPVNINVTVNRSAEGAISQTSQSLTSNAVAAQMVDPGTATTSDIQSNQARAVGPQVANNAIEGQGMSHGQAQATTQTASASNAAKGESGIARSTSQVMGSATQTNVDGASATTQSNTLQTQQTNNVQKPAQVQAQQSPEQNRDALLDHELVYQTLAAPHGVVDFYQKYLQYLMII